MWTTRFKIAACAMALTFSGHAAAAENFPERPITIIVGVAPGGTLDTLARVIGDLMSQNLKQPVIVNNVTGAGGLIGYKKLMDSEPDGHTLMFSNMSLAIIPHLHPTADVQPLRDLQMIGTVATVPMVLSVSKQSGIEDLPSMLERMRGGDRLNFGSGGPGTTAHLAEGMFLHLSKTKGELIQYRGTGPALVDLMAGTIDAVIDQTVTMMPLHQEQRIKSIAVASPERLKQMPDVPTFAEGGLPEFDLAIWNGVVAPKGTPAPVVEKLASALSDVVDSEPFMSRLNALAASAPSAQERGPEAFEKLLAQDLERVSETIEQANLLPRK